VDLLACVRFAVSFPFTFCSLFSIVVHYSDVKTLLIHSFSYLSLSALKGLNLFIFDLVVKFF